MNFITLISLFFIMLRNSQDTEQENGSLMCFFHHFFAALCSYNILFLWQCSAPLSFPHSRFHISSTLHLFNSHNITFALNVCYAGDFIIYYHYRQSSISTFIGFEQKSSTGYLGNQMRNVRKSSMVTKKWLINAQNTYIKLTGKMSNVQCYLHYQTPV